jgi:hypothetical protein
MIFVVLKYFSGAVQGALDNVLTLLKMKGESNQIRLAQGFF